MDETPVEQGLDAEDVPPEAPAAEAPDVEPGETPETPEESGAKPAGKPDGIQRRFDELTRKRHEAEREAAYWKGKAEGRTPEPAAAPQPEARPHQDQYQSYEEYIEALTDWKLSERLTAERARLHQEREAQTVVQGFEAEMKSAREKHADFDAVVFNPDLRVSETMRDAIVHSEDGANLAYYLGQHPEEAARIAALAPMAQVLAMGRLQASLDARATTRVAPTSNAPAPISPVKASAPSPTGLREDLPIGDWMRRRNAELHKR